MQTNSYRVSKPRVNSDAFDQGPRRTLYIVAVQTLTRTVLEYIRHQGRDRHDDAIREAKARHGRQAIAARVIGMRAGE